MFFSELNSFLMRWLFPLASHFVRSVLHLTGHLTVMRRLHLSACDFPLLLIWTFPCAHRALPHTRRKIRTNNNVDGNACLFVKTFFFCCVPSWFLKKSFGKFFFHITLFFNSLTQIGSFYVNNLNIACVLCCCRRLLSLHSKT